jgi:hypothetical protein
LTRIDFNFAGYQVLEANRINGLLRSDQDLLNTISATLPDGLALSDGKLALRAGLISLEA